MKPGNIRRIGIGLLEADPVHDYARDSRSCNAPNEGASCGPTDLHCIKMEAPAQITNSPADNNVVVSEQQSSESRNAGRNDQVPFIWNSRIRRGMLQWQYPQAMLFSRLSVAS